MKYLSAFLVLSLVAIGLAPSAQAVPVVFQAALDGASENPPNASPGTGTALVTFDTAAHTMRVEVTFSDLLAPNSAAHIHCCVDPPGNVQVATTTPTFTGFPSGVTSGTYDHTFDMTNLGSYNAAFVTAHGGTAAGAEADLFAGMESGRAYLNIHTSVFPGGEIRGFLAPVPEPGSLGLVALGLLGALVARRRRG